MDISHVAAKRKINVIAVIIRAAIKCTSSLRDLRFAGSNSDEVD